MSLSELPNADNDMISKKGSRSFYTKRFSSKISRFDLDLDLAETRSLDFTSLKYTSPPC
jgi:hypothetical protein